MAVKMLSKERESGIIDFHSHKSQLSSIWRRCLPIISMILLLFFSVGLSPCGVGGGGAGGGGGADAGPAVVLQSWWGWG